ncbi:DUF131 domain-containing protein [Candidatus Thorarchaeota archaeon]|nr:MAG: DUF131 domain-containing protein [Candidatus Thorarchaeota archaeon]
MQLIGLLQLLGWMSLFVGIIILCLVFARDMSTSDSGGYETKTENKGVVLLGPIPIVWGYGKKGWIVAGVIGITIFIIMLLVTN